MMLITPTAALPMRGLIAVDLMTAGGTHVACWRGVTAA